MEISKEIDLTTNENQTYSTPYETIQNKWNSLWDTFEDIGWAKYIIRNETTYFPPNITFHNMIPFVNTFNCYKGVLHYTSIKQIDDMSVNNINKNQYKVLSEKIWELMEPYEWTRCIIRNHTIYIAPDYSFDTMKINNNYFLSINKALHKFLTDHNLIPENAGKNDHINNIIADGKNKRNESKDKKKTDFNVTKDDYMKSNPISSNRKKKVNLKNKRKSLDSSLSEKNVMKRHRFTSNKSNSYSNRRHSDGMSYSKNHNKDSEYKYVRVWEVLKEHGWKYVNISGLLNYAYLSENCTKVGSNKYIMNDGREAIMGKDYVLGDDALVEFGIRNNVLEWNMAESETSNDE